MPVTVQCEHAAIQQALLSDSNTPLREQKKISDKWPAGTYTSIETEKVTPCLSILYIITAGNWERAGHRAHPVQTLAAPPGAATA